MEAHENCQREIDSRYASDGVRSGDSKEPETEKSERLFWVRYFNQQKACIKTLSKLRKTIKAEIPDLAGSAVYVRGSLARLEYIPGCSDVDILIVRESRIAPGRYGVIQTKVTGIVSEAMKKMESQIAEREKRDYPVKLRATWRKLEPREEIPVEVSWVPFRNRKQFYTQETLLGAHGTAYEAAWANGDRSCLLFESVGLLDTSFTEELRGSADGIYKLSEDLGTSFFPTLLCAFGCSNLASALLERVAMAREGKDSRYLDDSIAAKAVTARIWGTRVTQVMLHLLYWLKMIDNSNKDKYYTTQELLRFLRAPTIEKILIHLPQLLALVQDGFGAYAEGYILGPSREPANRAFRYVVECVKPNSPSDNNLVKTYLNLWQLALKARAGEGILKPKEREQIRRDIHNLFALLTKATQITEYIQSGLTGIDSAIPYLRLGAIIRSEVFPEVEPVSN